MTRFRAKMKHNHQPYFAIHHIMTLEMLTKYIILPLIGKLYIVNVDKGTSYGVQFSRIIVNVFSTMRSASACMRAN